MAETQKPTAPASAPAAAFDFGSIQVTSVAALPKTARSGGTSNPLAKLVNDSVDAGVKAFEVPSGKLAQKADRHIRSAANSKDYGSKVRFTAKATGAVLPAKGIENYPGAVLVHMNVTSNRNRKSD